MDMDYYSRVFGDLFEAKLINAGWNDFLNGRMRDGETVMQELKEKYEI
jgi:hypothetical protein